MNIYPPGYGPTFTCIQRRVFVTFEVSQAPTQPGDMEMLLALPARPWMPYLPVTTPMVPLTSNLPQSIPSLDQNVFAQNDFLGNTFDNWIPDLDPGLTTETSASPCSLPTDDFTFPSPSECGSSSSSPGHNTTAPSSTSSTPPTMMPTSILARSSWPAAAPAANQNVALEPQPPNHLHCPVCTKPHSKRRSLNRHIWANHRAYAQRNDIPSEDESCHVCGRRMRKDNLKRHIETRHGC